MARYSSSPLLCRKKRRKVSETFQSWSDSSTPIAEALAASVVKVAGRDVLATWKILISLGLAPVLYTFYAIVATLVAAKAHASLTFKLWTPFLVICALPFMNYAALKFGEAGVDVFK